MPPALRDVTLDLNKIKFTIPVHILNSENVDSGVTRNLAFGIKVDDTKLWSALHEITLRDYQPPGGAVSTPYVNGVS